MTVPAVNIHQPYPTLMNSYSQSGGAACGWPNVSDVPLSVGQVGAFNRIKTASINTKPWAPTLYPKPQTLWLVATARLKFLEPAEGQQTYDVFPCKVVEVVKSYGRNNTWSLFQVPTIAPTASLLNKSGNGILQNIADATQSSLGLNIIEAERTFRTFGDSFTTIAKGARKLHTLLSPKSWVDFCLPDNRVRRVGSAIRPRQNHLRPRGLRYRDRYGNDVSKTVLQVQYGWKPLIGDLYNASRIIDERRLGNQYTFSKEYTGRETIDWQTSYPGYQDFYTTVYGLQEMSLKYKYWYRLNTSTLGDLAAAGVTNPLGLVWELVPYSFIVDWALNIGAWLNTLNVGAGLSGLAGSKYLLMTIRDTKTVSSVALPFTLRKHGRIEVNVEGRRRDPVTTLPSVKPELKNPFSKQHVLNSLALLSEVLLQR